MGLAVMEGPCVLFSTCVETAARTNFHDRLIYLGKIIERCIKKWNPSVLVCEKLFFTKNQKTAMHVAEVRGVILYIAGTRGLFFHEFTPLEIKTAVAGYGKADKAHVAKMVMALAVITNKPTHDDEYDAIAVGLAYNAVEKIIHNIT